VKELSGKQYQGETVKPMRIIADHLRAAVFILGDENAVMPSNLERGYILRRLIRRAIRFAKMIGLDSSLVPLAEIAIKEYGELYSELITNQDIILAELKKEEDKFKLTVEKGLREFDKLSSQDISGKNAFLLFQSYGFPLEMTEEMADEKGIKVDTESFLAEYEKHQAASKKGVEKKFKGGLADLSLEVIRLHTATHLLNEVLRKVISPDIKQRGSNITPDRLRFDFSFDRKLTPEEILKVEDELNRVIKADLAVERKEMSRSEAEKIGAEKEFGQKYPEIVSVYLIGDYSKEFCGGPHVEHTGELGHFKIIKEQSSSAGVRRIKAVLE
jgi:alanyl-tRNA synthetase